MKLMTIDDLAVPGVEQRLAQAEGIYEMYCRHLEEKKESQVARAPGVHASEIMGCTRRAVFSIRGVDKLSTPSLPWKRRFAIGHAVHDMIQKQFQDMGKNDQMMIKFDPEVPINPFGNEVAARYKIFSSCDGVFTFYDRYEHGWEQVMRLGCEIKTESPDGFAKLTKPKQEHIGQAHVYMKCLNIPLMWFVYYNKGNQNMTPSVLGSFLIKYDPAVWEEVSTRADFLLALAATEEIPEKEEGIMCEFCPYAWTCEPDYLKRQSFAITGSRSLIPLSYKAQAKRR